MGGLLSCNQLAHIEEIVQQIAASSGKPSYSFGYSSAATVNTWQEHGPKISSNKNGIPFGLNNGQITNIWVGNSQLVAFDITAYWHLGDEVSLTALTTVSIPSTSRIATFNVDDFGIVNVPKDVQIAFRVTAVPGSNPRDIGLHATIVGTA